MTGRRKSMLAVLAATAACLATAAAAPAATTNVRTFPPTEGVRFAFGDRILRSDASGIVRVPAGLAEAARRLRPMTTRIGPRRRASLGRVFERDDRLVVTLSIFYRVGLRFVNLQGVAVDTGIVRRVVIKGGQGRVYEFRPGQSRWLQGTRVVSSSERSGFRVKDIDYGVQRASIENSNTVNAGQQRFFPSRIATVPVRLLLYSARFEGRDSFFGFRMGSAIVLRYPSGREERHELKDGEAVLRALPRGEYEVKAEGLGFSFTRPVSLSRNQEVSLEMMSYLDIGLVLLVVAAFVIGLPLMRRPELLSGLAAWYRRRVRRVPDRTVTGERA